jgi:hypothetical protein
LDSLQVAHQQPGGQYKHVPLQFNAETGEEQRVQYTLSNLTGFWLKLTEVRMMNTVIVWRRSASIN